jgi:hypothetical protein
LRIGFRNDAQPGQSKSLDSRDLLLLEVDAESPFLSDREPDALGGMLAAARTRFIVTENNRV